MKIFKRILLGLLGVVLGLVILLFASIFVDGFFSQSRLEPITNTSIAAADGTAIRAYVAKPSGAGPYPAVIMIHEFYGLRPEMVGKAEALAKQGYVVIAPNVFRTGTTNWIPSAIYKVITADNAQIDGDVEAGARLYLQSAKAYIPHFYATVEVRAENILGMREQLKNMGLKVSVNDCISHAKKIAKTINCIS